MLERVIEERARGNPASAAAIRNEVLRLVGDDLSKLKPGSPEAMRLKEVLIEQGAWSQYLEVGIGPDAEVFTKAPTMSSVGTGMDAGLHPKSTWNNPEPEVVLVVVEPRRDRRRHARQRRQPARFRRALGAATVEGQGQQRLLRGRPVRCGCSTDSFSLDDVRKTDVGADSEGRGRFHARGPFVDRQDQPRSGGSGRADHRSAPSISRRLCAVPRHHVRAGRRTATRQARASPTSAATSSPSRRPKLGKLVNRMRTSDECEPWTFGIGALMRNLAKRGIL